MIVEEARKSRAANKIITHKHLYNAGLVFLILLLSGCVSATQSGYTQKYIVKQVSGTTYIEAFPKYGPRGYLGAIYGTIIAASIQTQPIKLKNGIDFACNYKEVVTTDIQRCNEIAADGSQ